MNSLPSVDLHRDECRDGSELPCRKLWRLGGLDERLWPLLQFFPFFSVRPEEKHRGRNEEKRVGRKKNESPLLLLYIPILSSLLLLCFEGSRKLESREERQKGTKEGSMISRWLHHPPEKVGDREREHTRRGKWNDVEKKPQCE